MLAVHVVRVGPPEAALEVREVPDPRPGPCEVLVRVEAAGVNFADILARTGAYPDAPALPFVPGYEVAGAVVEVGSDVRSVAVGQRVAGLTSFGGYAGKAICHQDGVVALPDGMDCVKAAAVPVNGATAWLALHGLIRVRAQDRVFIRSAAGGVGLMAAQMALGAGCEVFGAVGTDAKVEFLKGLGVHHPMNHQAADIEGEVRTVTGGCGLDLVLDSAGGDAIASGLRMLGAGGRLVSIGVSSIMPRTDGPQTSAGPTLQRATVLHPYTLLAEGKGLVGINLMRLSEQRPALVGQALRAAFDLVFTGRVRVHVDSVHPFEAATQAHLRLQGGRSIGKVVIGFGG